MIGTQGYPRLVKASTLAEILEVSTRTIRSWSKEGRLPYIRISPGTTRYDVDEVLAALEERKVNAQPTRPKK